MDSLYLPRLHQHGNVSQVLAVLFSNAVYCAKNDLFYDLITGCTRTKVECEDGKFYQMRDRFTPAGQYCIPNTTSKRDDHIEELLELRERIDVCAPPSELIYLWDQVFCFPQQTKDEDIEANLREFRARSKMAPSLCYWTKRPSEYEGLDWIVVATFEGSKQVLSANVAKREPWTEQQKLDIFNRTNGTCYLCNCKLRFTHRKRLYDADGFPGWEVEHVLALSGGIGTNLPENLLPSCWQCNVLKGDKALSTFIEMNPSRSVPVELLYCKELGEPALNALKRALFIAQHKHRGPVLLPSHEIRDIDIDEDSYFAGSFGTVFKGVWASCGLDVAVKMCSHTCSPLETQNLIREANTLRSLIHPNIVQCLGFYQAQVQDVSSFALIMEWIPDTLDKHIRLRKREPSNLSILTQVVLAMLFLSSRNIMHRDLKPLNILILAKSIVKVADVGLAKLATSIDDAEDNRHTMGVGTGMYRAPELRNGLYGLPVDVFSFGKIAGELPKLSQEDSWFVDIVHDACTVRDPAKRPTWTSLLKFLRKPSKDFRFESWGVDRTVNVQSTQHQSQSHTSNSGSNNNDNNIHTGSPGILNIPLVLNSEEEAAERMQTLTLTPSQPLTATSSASTQPEPSQPTPAHQSLVSQLPTHPQIQPQIQTQAHTPAQIQGDTVWIAPSRRGTTYHVTLGCNGRYAGTGWVQIARPEAEGRGYKKCPNCCFEKF